MNDVNIKDYIAYNDTVISEIRGDYARDMEWCMDLLTAYTHNLELQVITALSLISTLHKSPQHPISLFVACCVFIGRSLATASNSGDSSASRARVLSSQPPVQNSTLNYLNWLGRPNFLPYKPFAQTELNTLFPTVTLLL
jgi:hypothetical protein